MILRRFRASFLACACVLGLGFVAAPAVHAAGTVLEPGDIAVLGFNASDATDPDDDGYLDARWAVVVLRQLEIGTVVKFTAQGVAADGLFIAGDGGRDPDRYTSVNWTITKVVPAGTVMVMDAGNGKTVADLNGSDPKRESDHGGLTDFGTAVGALAFQRKDEIDPLFYAQHGDQIIVFQGEMAKPTYIYAFSTQRSEPFIYEIGGWDQAVGYRGFDQVCALPPNLTDHLTAVALTSPSGPVSNADGPFGFENMVYNGPTVGTRDYLLRCIGTPWYWIGREDVGYPIGIGPGFQFASHFKVTTETPPSVIAKGLNPGFSAGGAGVALWNGVDAKTNDDGQRFTGLVLGVSGLVNDDSETLAINGTAVPLVAGGSGKAGSVESDTVAYSVVADGPNAVRVQLTTGPIFGGAMNALIAGLAYRNTATSLKDGTRAITILSITDDGSAGLNVGTPNLTSTVTVSPNRAPTLAATALNPSFGPQTTGVDLFGSVVAKTNNLGQVFVRLDLSLNGIVDGASEVLVVNGVDLPLLAGSGTIAGLGNYSTSGTNNSRSVTLSGLSLDDAAMSKLIGGLKYRNDAPAPALGARTVSIVLLHDSGAASHTLLVQPVLVSTVTMTANHAPVLTQNNPVLTPIAATDVANSGQTVESIIGTSITDADSGARRGIALAQFFLDYTRWQFSTNDGLSWTNFLAAPGNPEGSFLLLRAEDRVRYVPDGIHEGSASLVYLAWDQTGATAGMQGRWFDASGLAPYGGTTPFSADPDLAALTILGITPGSFQDWLVSNFTAAERQQAAYTSPSGDPAGCGVTNLMRYALNLATHGPVTVPTKLVPKTEGGVDYIALEFPRRSVAPGLTYTVQASSDLVTWTTVGSCGVEDGSLKTIRDTTARSTLPRRFLRLQVSLAP